MLEACETVLQGQGVHEAVATAELLMALAPADARVADVTERAYAHWRENEAPYPVKGGTVPPSTREALLAVRIRCGLADEALMAAAGDPRSDVRDTALAELISRATHDAALRRIFAAACRDGVLGLEALRRLLHHETPAAVVDAETLAPLLQSTDDRVREATLSLLDTRFLPRERIMEACEGLLEDPIDEIRRRAEYVLADLEPERD